MKTFFIISICLIVLVVFVLLMIMFRKKGNCSCCRRKKESYYNRYKGVVLFDIDGTLTSGKNNYKTVQNVLDKGYAVGICTAGSLYTPANIQSFSWMPSNLFTFMKKNNFNTFNNVASGILCGMNGIDVYKKSMINKPSNIFWPGWLKAVAMKKTGEKYKTKNVILLDNDNSFIQGVNAYDKNLKVICAGNPCGNIMTPNLTKNI